MNENRTERKKNKLWLLFPIVIILSYSYGLVTIRYRIFPYNQIRSAFLFQRDFFDNVPEPIRGEDTTYTLATYSRSYYGLLTNGRLDLKDSLPYRSEGIYHHSRAINPNESAIIVMDPWIDSPSDHLNEYYGNIAESKIVPLVRAAQTKGHPVIVLTNDCNFTQYSCKIHDELQDMANKEQISVIYHQSMDDEQFSNYLKKRQIKTLFYIGFASNMCVIGRKMGMIPMKLNGFQLLFVPEASAAVEEKDTWNSQSIHKETTKVISQWIGEIAKYEDMMNALSTN